MEILAAKRSKFRQNGGSRRITALVQNHDFGLESLMGVTVERLK
jgi:hypothetical protein